MMRILKKIFPFWMIQKKVQWSPRQEIRAKKILFLLFLTFIFLFITDMKRVKREWTFHKMLFAFIWRLKKDGNFVVFSSFFFYDKSFISKWKRRQSYCHIRWWLDIYATSANSCEKTHIIEIKIFYSQVYCK